MTTLNIECSLPHQFSLPRQVCLHYIPGDELKSIIQAKVVALMPFIKNGTCWLPSLVTNTWTPNGEDRVVTISYSGSYF